MAIRKINQILNEVLKDIQPDKKYEKEIFERIKDIIKKINKNQKSIKAVLGGSGAKGTWLKTFDADIFVLFDYTKYKDKSDKLSDALEKILRSKFKGIIRLHGSRDYFQIKQGNFTFEIVPILKIKKAEQAMNITDVSPLHSRWVAKHKRLIDDMKLTKQFCQAQNIYGAESYIRGFSGYVCEVMTVNYGSFLGLIKNAAKWKEKQVIDVEKYYKGNEVFRIVNTSKLISPLIIIDPVQKDRNAAAALSNEKFDRFVNSARGLLKIPSKEFFQIKPLKSIFVEQKKGNQSIIEIKIKPLAGKIDVVGSKLLKIFEHLNAQLIKNGFNAINADWEWDKKSHAFFYFLFPSKPLPAKKEIEGPPIELKDHVANFKKAHKKTFAKRKKMFAVEKRKFTRPQALLKKALADSFVKEKSKSAELKIL